MLEDQLARLLSLWDWYLTSPLSAQILMAGSIVLMIFGQLLIMAISARRRGIPYRMLFIPTAEAFEQVFDLNNREVIWLVALLSLASVAGAVGVVLGLIS